METREELVTGLGLVSSQARLVARMLDATNEWDVRRPAGWTPKEMFIHVAATLGMWPTIGAGVLKAPAESDVVAGMDIAEFNEKGIAAMRSMDARQTVEQLVTNCSQMAEWVKSLTDQQMAATRTFRGTPMTTFGLLTTATVMHSIHHLFEAPLSVPA